MGSKSGLTVGQGLVIGAVLVILVGTLLFRVYKNNWDYQSQPQCTSNMKHLGMAMLQYAQDYDGTLPPSKMCNGSEVTNRQVTQTIVNLLDPYLGKTSSGEQRNPRTTWRCPAQRGHGLYVKSTADEKGAAGTVWPLHYVCNRNLLRPVGGEFLRYRYLNAKERKGLTQRGTDYVVESRKAFPISTGMKVTDVKEPASTIALLEWHQEPSSCPLCPEDESIVADISQPDWDGRVSSSAPYLKVHGYGLNIGFADGHVKWFIASSRLKDYQITFYPDENPQKPR